MNKEIEALENNDTWHLMQLSQGKKPIGCKWVYQIKRNAYGTIERYKARLVAKGYTQVDGEDYIDSSSLVSKAVIVRFVFVLAAAQVLLVYVDDILVAGNDLLETEGVKQYLHMIFTIKDLGRAKLFLGVEVVQTTQGIYLKQRKYVALLEASQH
ncbi:hypothetical protein LIER_25735 [Lithospermum erythrorhizon]|uniref:Reverse transcriptase Ty1/copia-type domain-containing protein n=1 Tax=Lithospermum erythrorhizon TaxID=34254 RepID=A0AAV3R935_LITER